MKRRMRPILDRSDMPMADRIEVQVIHMDAMIVLVADHMFPVASLPDASLILADTACGDLFNLGQRS